MVSLSLIGPPALTACRPSGPFRVLDQDLATGFEALIVAPLALGQALPVLDDLPWVTGTAIRLRMAAYGSRPGRSVTFTTALRRTSTKQA